MFQSASLKTSAAVWALWLLASLPLYGSILTFEGLEDLQPVNNFYANVSFSSAIAEIAGFSLNDAELPPASGGTVALNDGSPITINWASPVTRFEGLFTYTAPLTLRFFSSGAEVGTAVSVFGNNLAFSGELGSKPNEAISFTAAGSFDSVRVESAGSYGLDDVSFDETTQVVPEPLTTLPVLAALMFILYPAVRLRARERAQTKRNRKVSRMNLIRGITAVFTMGCTGACMAASIDNAAITPGSAPTGDAATVTITAQIADPSIIASSVNLQRIDIQGRVLEVIGSMVDDGTKGDSVAGDRVFTIRFTILEEKPGSLSYRVSAGVLGSLNRIFSSPVLFNSTGNVATGIAVTQPSNLTFVNISPITIVGTTGDPGAVVRVNGITANKSGNSFQVSVPLQEGNNTITAVATNTNSSSDSAASIQVTLDTTPPHVSIDSPPPSFTTAEPAITVTGIVNDIVVGTVNGGQAAVTVNGVPAQVANRHYTAAGVPLSLGENTIQVTARDQTGNSAAVSAKVTREAEGQQFIKLISGDNQNGPVGTALPVPLMVQLLKQGAPASNVPVIYKITENDGSLRPGNARLIVVNTNTQGQAQTALTLGLRSGAGNNTVQAYAAGYQGIAVFHASGIPKQAAKINVDSGNSQFGAIAKPLALPFVVVVTDEAHNRLANIPVAFTVKQGGGTIGGQTTIQATTDGDGRALVVLTLGSQPGQDNNIVEATFAGNPGAPARFTGSAKVPGNPAQTSISGLVLDNSNNPIPGVTMRLFQTNQGSNNNQPMQIGTPVPTNAKGVFQITPAPVGFFKLMADGTTAAGTGKSYPTLEYDLVTVAGQDNGVGMPIYLPALDPVAKVCVSATTGGELRSASSPDFSLNLLPGSATFPGGSKTGCVSVTPVNPDKIPMVPGFGQQPRFIVTIQPVGTTFNPPASITIPNMDGLAPNSKTEMYSYDHDLAAFVTIGTATASTDGSVIASDPGVGVLKAGWHAGGNPLPAGSAAPVTVTINTQATLATVASATPTFAPRAATIQPSKAVLAKDEVTTLTATGSPEGTFTWSTSDSSVAAIVDFPVNSFVINVKGGHAGKSTLTVRYRGAKADLNGVHPIAEASVDVLVYTIDSISIDPSGDTTFVKPDRFSKEIDGRIEAAVVTNFGNIPDAPNLSIVLRFGFEDPDDTAASPGIDANGPAGDDNAPVSAGGKRGPGSVMWKTSNGFTTSIFPDGQSALVLTSTEAADKGKARALFLSSVVAGDNYLLKVQAVDSKGNVLKEARSGVLSVRKQLTFDKAYQMAGGIDIGTIMATETVAPAFSGDGYTDYFTGDVRQLAAGTDSPEFLVPLENPTLAETPTAEELADYASSDLVKQAIAKVKIQVKAQAWHDRSMGVAFDDTIRHYFDQIGLQGPATLGIRSIHPKLEGSASPSVNTNFYPPGIQIAGGDFLPDGTQAIVDPDGAWEIFGGLELGTITVVPLLVNRLPLQVRQIIGRHEAGHASDHVEFGEGDHADSGLMFPSVGFGSKIGLTFSDDSILKLRGRSR